MEEYEKKVRRGNYPLDLGFCRWIKETYRVSIRFFFVESPKGSDAVLIECQGINALPSGEHILRHDDLAIPEGYGRGELLLLVHKLGVMPTIRFRS